MHLLLVSSSLGAGHRGMAKQLTTRLIATGHTARTVDYLDLLPFHSGGVAAAYYAAQLRYAPESYERVYRSYARIHGRFAMTSGRACWHALRKLLQSERPDAIVSNNPHASMGLGYLVERGLIDIPVLTYITDVGVHPLWVHPHVDAHLVIHARSAEEAEAFHARDVVVAGPIVDSKFREARRDRDLLRRLGIEDGELAVLVTSGSWGVGQLERTVEDVISANGLAAIVVCGRQKRVARRLRNGRRCAVIEWTDDMPGLVASSDVMLENAGGLTSLEAMAAGLPVVSYRPIPGHGRHNAASMEAAGLATYVRHAKDLVATLRDKGSMERRAGAFDTGTPAQDPVEVIERILLLRRQTTTLSDLNRSPRRL